MILNTTNLSGLEWFSFIVSSGPGYLHHGGLLNFLKER